MTPLDTDASRTLRRIERKLDLLLEAACIEINMEEKMDAAGEALKTEIEQLDADVKADNEAVIAGGEAVATAGTKFAELKALLEKQASGAALSDEEAASLTTLTTEVDTSLGAANTSLTEHVKALGEETAAA